MFALPRHGLLVVSLSSLALCLAIASASAEEPISYSTADVPAHDKIRKALMDQTSLEFIEAPLSDIVEFLKTKHNIEIQFDTRALQEASLEAATISITRYLKDLTLRSALRLILRDIALTYVIRDEVLMITTKVAADEMLETRIYPVRDLLDADTPRTVETDYQPLIEIIRTALPSGSEQAPGGIVVFTKGESLVINASNESHETISDLLNALRRGVKSRDKPVAEAKK